MKKFARKINKFLRTKTGIIVSITIVLIILIAIPLFKNTHFFGKSEVIVSINEFDLPSANSGPDGITVDTTGNIWFTEESASKIGKYNIQTEQITEYPLPANRKPREITSDPYGNIWFAEVNKIGKVTSDGTVSEYDIFGEGNTPAQPLGITTRSNGEIWFTEGTVGSNIGKINQDGQYTLFKLSYADEGLSEGLTFGPDGKLWFTVSNCKIGRVSVDNLNITGENPPEWLPLVPCSSLDGGGPAWDVASDYNSNVWYTQGNNIIGKYTIGGVPTTYTIQYTDNKPPRPWGITVDNNGVVWFTENNKSNIARITAEGTMLEYPLPNSSSNQGLTGITKDQTGRIWFTEASGNKIGRVNFTNVTPAPSTEPTLTPTPTSILTPTITPSSILTQIPTNTPFPTLTPTSIPIKTPTPTFTPAPTFSPTPTRIPTPVAPSNTPTLTPTSNPTPTNTTSRNGLNAAYYNNLYFSSKIVTRIDPVINFDWGFGSPASGIGPDTFSVRWTGYIVPKYSQTYRFYARTDDGVRLWVNGVKIIDYWKNQVATERIGSINLTAGLKYAIKMEYYDNLGRAVAQLSWSSPSQVKQIIPKTQFYSN